MKQINISCPLNNLSYGYVGQNLVKALIKSGVQVNLRLIGNLEIDEEAGYGEYIHQCGKKFEDGAPHIILWHHFGLKELCLPNCQNIGFPIFETNEFDVKEIDNFNAVDTIVVASEWYQKILQKIEAIQKPVKVVHLGYDPDIFSPTLNLFVGFVNFLHIGKWEIRKNQLGLLKAFGEEFENDKDASLMLACDNPFIGPDNTKWGNLAKSYVPTVKMISNRYASCKQIASLIQSSNIGIYPSLAEGFNLPLLESMASNRFCIATNYSAHTSFCNHENSYLIEPTGEAPMYDGQFFNGTGQWISWGEVQHNQLKQQLRKAYNLAKENQLPNILDIEKFTWEQSVKQLLEIL